MWGRGVSNSYGKCHIVRMRGAPVFVINPATPLDTPFSGVDAQVPEPHTLNRNKPKILMLKPLPKLHTPNPKPSTPKP